MKCWFPRLAGKSLLKIMKRWPSLISKCVLSLTENLRKPSSPEYVVLGSCAVLSTQTVLKHLTTVGFWQKEVYTYLHQLFLSYISFYVPGSEGIFFISAWDPFQVSLI